MDLERVAKQVQSITGLIGVIGGLIVALAAFSRQVREAIRLLTPFGVPVLLVLAALLLAFGLLLLAAARRKGSRLLDPHALRLDPRRPEHLIGRAEDVRLLREKCEARPLVFLVGDSGTGKSALVQAGLMPETAEGRLLPVYIDMADLDWEAGPMAALADRFWRSLSADERKALASERPPAIDALGHLLAACYSTIGRTPLILLDQLDDYQLRHRNRFLPSTTRSWIPFDELMAQNVFWAMLAPLVAAGQVHLLLITRSDSADGLESLRLAPDPRVVRLDPLPAGFVLGVVDQLTLRAPGAPPVVESPERGWTRLRVRLADDLEHSGAVLPQQLKVVLLGLARLSPLSVPSYDRAGGIAGLETRYIEDALARAASRAGLGPAAVRTALMPLVERDGPRRAPPATSRALADALPEPEAARLHAAVEALEEMDILRRRDTGGELAWQLDHDYLARGLLRAEANADRWKALLAQRAREFANAKGSLRARWRTMLSLREQLGFLRARLLGRFRYGEHRGFALVSTAPYAVGAGVLALLVVGATAAIEIFKGEIVWTVIAPDTGISPLEYPGLGEIAKSGLIARTTFAHRLFGNSDYALRASIKPEPLARALVGLDEARAQMLVDWFIAPRLQGGDVDAVHAAASILPLLPRSAQDRLPPLFVEALERARVDAGPAREAVLIAAGRQPTMTARAASRADTALGRLRSAREAGGARADYEIAYAAGVLAVSSEQLPADLLPPVLIKIREELRLARGRREAVAGLARAYAEIGRRLADRARAGIIADLIDEMRAGRGDSYVLQVLAFAQQVAGRGLPAELARPLAAPLLKELSAARREPEAVVPIALAFAATVPPLAQERGDAARIVLEELRDSRRASAPVGWLAEAHATLTLASPTAMAERQEVLAAMLDAPAGGWARREQSPDLSRPLPPPQTASVRQLFDACGLGDCFALLAATVLDAAVAQPFDARAVLVLELLKVPASTRLRLTEALLARLRAERGADNAGLQAAELWEFVAWANARGFEPGRPLDMERLLDALPH